MKYLFFVLLLSGCTTAAEVSIFGIGDDFKPQVAEFRQHYKGDMPPYLSVQYGDPTGPYAECITSKNWYAPKTVIIRQTAWLGMEPEQKLATVFHELGHCILGLYVGVDHPTNQLSYMYIDLRSEQFYLDNKEVLIKELF